MITFQAFKYKNYLVKQAKPSGGKAGKGMNVTSTVQAIRLDTSLEDLRFPYKHFKYKMGDREDLKQAIKKACLWIDECRNKMENAK